MQVVVLCGKCLKQSLVFSIISSNLYVTRIHIICSLKYFTVCSFERPVFTTVVWLMLTCAANLPLPQGLHGGFDSWLGGCEAKLAEPVKTQRNPVGTRKQLEELKVC